MSVSKDIKDLVITTVNNLGFTQAVYGYEELNPTGWPCVWIKAADMDGTFATTAENQRIYAYSVTSLFPLGEDFIKDSSVQREEYAENTLAAVVDEIIDAVDDNSFLTEINNYSSGDAEGIFIEASDVEWGEADMQKGKAKAVRITLRIHTYYNVTT